MMDLLGAVIGGVLIGGSAAGLLLVNGRIAGISGILAQAVRGWGRGGAAEHWRLAFLAGLIAAGVGARLLGIAPPDDLTRMSPVLLVAAGLLVGVGTRLGSGCTSGHGVCGLSNLSLRSLVATVCFMVTAMTTVFIVRHLLRG